MGTLIYGPGPNVRSSSVAVGFVGIEDYGSLGKVVGPRKNTRSSTLKIGLIPMSGGSSNTCIWT